MVPLAAVESAEISNGSRMEQKRYKNGAERVAGVLLTFSFLSEHAYTTNGRYFKS